MGGLSLWLQLWLMVGRGVRMEMGRRKGGERQSRVGPGQRCGR